jgi:inositol oxygenase
MSDGLPRSPARAYALAVTDRTPPRAYQKRAPRGFRDHRADARPSVRNLYRLQHSHQTVEFVKAKRREYLSLDRRRMGIWEAMEFLDQLVDDSDPDTELSQREHLLQTAEAARRAGHPGWFVLTALIHDLGKILCLFGEPQWAVVGDTFPVGCHFSEKVIYHEFFADNPDRRVPVYSTRLGMYQEGGGLDDVLMSWGHDEYLYHVVKHHLPDEALYVIRYHSFYAAHREGGYEYLMNDRDRRMLPWVRTFSAFDLYSKGDERPDPVAERPYYERLIGEFFPSELAW